MIAAGCCPSTHPFAVYLCWLTSIQPCLMRSSASLCGQHQSMPGVEQVLPFSEFGIEYSFGHPRVVHAPDMGGPANILM